MNRALLLAGLLAVVLALLVVAFVGSGREPASPLAASSTPAPVDDLLPHPSLLHGRVTTRDDRVYEGRLRWGGGEEAFWGEYFNGRKADNPWRPHVPPEALVEPDPLELFGFTIVNREREVDLGRPFMARLGDIARIESLDRIIRVTLKSGETVDLDAFAADDFADGLRVWDATHGVVDLTERQIRLVVLLPGSDESETPAPARIHGTVHTPSGTFSGFIQWNRNDSLASDTLDGHDGSGDVAFPYGEIRSIARASATTARVTLADGRDVEISGSREAGDGNLGLYVDDLRYGRVLVPWRTFERVDLSPGAGGPGYDDFPIGHPLRGSVVTRDGRRLAGRIVYDLDEAESTATLDAPAGGVNYTIPFALVTSIERIDAGAEAPIGVTLAGGERLALEPSGDLGDGNAGMLVFPDGADEPTHVPWEAVERIDLDTTAAPAL